MYEHMIEGYRLSPQQAHLWRLQQGEPRLPYRTQGTVDIAGPLHPARLHAALERVVRRHEILRTTFRSLPAMPLPLQVIAAHLPPAFAAEDVSGCDAPAQAARVEALWHEMSQAPFDLAHGPLVQACLVRLAPDQHRLLLGVPALCADAVGLANVVRELSRCYGAGVRGEALADAPLQYADLAEWQHELLASEEMATGRAYWREQALVERLPAKLPFEQPRAPALGPEPGAPQGFAPQGCAVMLERELVEQLEGLARQQETSVAVLLLACWQLLLGRLTGQADMLVGTLYDGRNYDELQEALGLFARYLPLCSHLEDNFTIHEVLNQLNESARDAETWQECFTWEYFADSHREVGTPPFFPFCFEFAPPPTRYAAGEATFSMVQTYTCIDRFHVKLTCERGPEGLRAVVQYDAQRYRAAEMACVAQQWLTVVRSVVRTPEAPLHAVELLSAAERQQLLGAGHAPPRPYPREPLIHERVEAQAARQPDAVAVVVEDQYLSYGALNGRANQLAQHLQQLGVGPEGRVGLCLARSPELLVGLLGILKAGGAYVPLEPGLPQERLAYMLAAAQPRVVLTHAGVRERLPAQAAPVVGLERAWAGRGQEAAENVRSGVGPANLVYVLFTSGSTGRPKGVAVEHRQLGNYVHSIVERLGLPAGARYATVTTLAADLGNTAVFAALCTGGTLHVVGLERAADPAALAAYVGREALDCVKMVPSHLAALLTSAQAAQGVPRQRLVLGGEACGWEVVRRVQELAPACVVVNHYGPTETTVGVLTYRVEQEPPAYASATVPLGRPLGNTQVYVLDAHGHPVPPWVAGEVYIGGAQVGRGYLGQPELTAERFVPDPFSAEPGARLYRTGDGARSLPDGTLEFLGRLDQQVKLRGFRIELGEIEAVLRQHPAVQASVVVVREAGAGEPRLVAYVVGQGAVEAGALRRFVQERVPDYMVPAAFVPLAALPLTANGKVDRQALPAPEGVRSGLEDDFMAPRTLLEELVAGIWAEVLGVARVGVHDNFFELGGHSLMVTRVASRVSEALQVELPFRLLFEKRTVADLAKSIEAARRGGQALQAPPILSVSRDGELPLSFAQQRLWFFDQLEPHSPAYSIPGAVRLAGALNVAALEQTFTEIVRRHEGLRTTFPTVEGRPRQVIAPAIDIRLPVVDLRALPPCERETEVRRLTVQEARRPFILDRGPLLRAGLLRLGEHEHVLFFAMHHIVSDAWSMGVLVREVTALYEAFSTGKPSPLPELHIQYADFASWQRQWLQGDVLESHVSYWKQHLDGAPKVLELPMDRPRPSIQTWRGAREAIVLPNALTAALKALSRREGVTLFMTLLAAFKTLIRHYTTQDDIVVGTNTANRSHSQTTGLIGFFVNQMVLRTDLSDNPRFRELLGRVREVALGAYAHQDLPFEKLVEELQPQRDMSRSLLFQIKFELQDGRTRTLELSGLTLTPLEVDHTVVRHDLHLFMIEREQELVGALLYKLDLFESSTIARIVDDFETLLNIVIEQPDGRLNELGEILDEKKRQQQIIRQETLEETSLKKLQTLRRKAIPT